MTVDGQPSENAVPPIRLAIETTADPGLAWRYITEPDRIAEWFTETTPLGEVGDSYRIDFGDGSVVEGSILEVEPGRRFSHRWAWLDDGASEPTVVTWEVLPAGAGASGCQIVLVHEGWSDDAAALRDDHEVYWSGYLDDLRDLLEDAGRATD